MNLSQTHDTDVLIAGAGPVGLVLASELLRFGVRARIVDKDPGTKTISKALILHVRTQECLGQMDKSIETILAEVSPLKRVEIHAYGEHLGAWDLDHIESPYEHPVIIGQNRTEALLEEHLNRKGGHVEWKTALSSFEQTADGVSAVLAKEDGSKETISARYLVGCDGASSIVRKTLEKQGLVHFGGDRYDNEQFIQADGRIRWNLPKGSSYLFLTEEGYMMVIEMPRDTVRVFISLPDPDPSNHTDPTLQEIENAMNRLGAVDGKLSEATWLARYRTSHRMASRFQVGRCFIAGDAGHIHVPIGGQGMNTGIQDALNLGWKLGYVCKRNTPETLLESYHEERSPVARDLLAGTDKAYRNVLHPNPLMQKVAQKIGPFIIRQNIVQEKMRATLEELGIHYRDSSWVKDCGGSAGPHAGERFLDARTVILGSQITTTLFELIRDTRFHLLAFSGSKPNETILRDLDQITAKVGREFGEIAQPHIVVRQAETPTSSFECQSILMDSEGYLHERFGAKEPCLYLLRPDLYVGFRGTATSLPDLLKYLSLFAARRPQNET